jgi:protein TonB
LPEYPPTSVRLGEEGATTLSCTIDEDGRAKECAVAESSGFPRLDEAAVKHATRNLRFFPGKEAGKAITYPDYKFRVVFRLQDAR